MRGNSAKNLLALKSQRSFFYSLFICTKTCICLSREREREKRERERLFFRSAVFACDLSSSFLNTFTSSSI
ncbi:hypothetical protein L1887_29130 [Cichorium endivia]|nr:hypothetical protein L1887_29130 [Cichorium endivia]